MIDIFFQAANLIPTGLFIIILLYWIVVLIGAIDFDLVDFDLDIDVDADADMDVDSSNIYGLDRFFRFFNVGKVPFMVFLTFLVMPLWFITVIVNHSLGFSSFLPGLMIMLPALFVSLFIAKLITTPLVKVFAALEKEDIQRDILGTIGDVRISASDTTTGQGEFKLGGSFLNISIRTKEGKVNVGEKVMIINDKTKDEYYIVEKYNEI